MNVLAIARSELDCRLRTESPHLLLAISVAILGTIAALGVWLAGVVAPAPTPMVGATTFSGTAPVLWQKAFAAQRGAALFFALALALVTLTAVLAPVIACATFNREHGKSTIESLLLTGLNPLTIVGAKTLAALAQTLLVLGAAVPPLAAAWLFGGVSLAALGATAAVIMALTLLSTAVAIFMSSLNRSDLAAVLYSYVLLGLIAAGGPAAFAVAMARGGQGEWLPLLYPSAPVALLSAYPDLVVTFQPLLPLAWRGLAQQLSETWFGLPFSYPALLANVVGYLALSGLLLSLSSILLDPLHPLRGLHWRPLPWSARR